eukprot:1159207-Pelagomonas_calceolata.AAC.11
MRKAGAAETEGTGRCGQQNNTLDAHLLRIAGLPVDWSPIQAATWPGWGGPTLWHCLKGKVQTEYGMVKCKAAKCQAAMWPRWDCTPRRHFEGKQFNVVIKWANCKAITWPDWDSPTLRHYTGTSKSCT